MSKRTMGPKAPADKLKLPTLLDIASQAGVAPMTVSRVINGSSLVSAKMREKVQRTIDQLGYRPNALARSLKSRRSHVVGILLSDIANPFSAELANSIKQALLEHGYTTFISTSERSVECERAALEAFVDNRVDGIVVATMETRAGKEALQRLIRGGLPCVVVGRESGEPGVDRVTADYRGGAFEAVEHLISLGHKRLGFIGASPRDARRLGRFRGLLDALEAHALTIDEKLIAGPEDDVGPGYSNQEDGYRGMQKLLSVSHPPTAICARNDFTAMGAICAARDSGVSIPDEVAVVGFDNVPMAAYFTPPLTTVAQPTAEQGRAAARMLMERIEGQPGAAYREVRFDCHLIVRQSTVRAASLSMTDARQV